MVELQVRQLSGLLVERLDGRRLPSHETVVLARLLERLHIKLRDAAPNHLASQLVGILAHRMAQRLVAQQFDHGARDAGGIAERNQFAAFRCQQFCSVPVRRGHHGVARAERIGQRA